MPSSIFLHRSLGEIIISEANFDNLNEILSLQKISFISEAKLYNNYEIEPLKQTIESIQEDFRTHTFLKAVYNNRIIGSVKGRNTGEYCWIGKLIVHPDFQNQGLGRKLMTEIENYFPESEKYVLFTGNRSDKNIHLYESMGYVKHEIYKDEKIPDVHLIKLIKMNLLNS